MFKQLGRPETRAQIQQNEPINAIILLCINSISLDTALSDTSTSMACLSEPSSVQSLSCYDRLEEKVSTFDKVKAGVFRLAWLAGEVPAPDAAGL